MAKRQQFIAGSTNPVTNKTLSTEEMNLLWKKLAVLKAEDLNGTFFQQSTYTFDSSNEIANALERFGITLDESNNSQLGELLQQLQDTSLVFKGFVSTSAPSATTYTLVEGNMWINSGTMPTTFPVPASQIKVWNGSAWVNATDPYTPFTLDIWRDINTNNGYYWVGGEWVIMSTDLSSTYFTLGADGKWEIKNNVALPGTPTVTNTPAASNSTTSKTIATVGWVNNASESIGIIHKTGLETVTGRKINTSRWDRQIPNINMSLKPASTIQVMGKQIVDANNVLLAFDQVYQTPSGSIRYQLGASVTQDDKQYFATLWVEVNPDGTVSSYVVNPPSGATGNQIATASWVLSKITAVQNDPAGTIKIWPGATTPTGYLPCNGSSISKNDYPALYAVIGTTYGGDGNPSFNLPNITLPVKATAAVTLKAVGNLAIIAGGSSETVIKSNAGDQSGRRLLAVTDTATGQNNPVQYGSGIGGTADLSGAANPNIRFIIKY